jgi:hypothetical protein
VFTFEDSVSAAELAGATLELSALGDFEPSNESAEVLPAERAGAGLRFPAETRAVHARLATSVASYAGYAERRDDDDLNVLVWPERRNVTLAEAGYPGAGGGQALGFSSASATLLLAGGNDPLSTEAILGMLRFSTDTGRAERTGVESGLEQPRAFATVTRFGDGFLVAGGERPVSGVPEAELQLHATAEAVGAPTARLLELHSTRTHHAALTLADGRTLLVGGRTKVSNVSIAQYELELVDPVEQRARLGDAITPRIDPALLALSDGRLFVGGGSLQDGSLSAPVGEWLSADAQRDATRLSPDVPPRFDRAFVAMPGGGVLAVGGCDDRPPSSESDRVACEVCKTGCPPLDGWDAWWIDERGGARPVLLPGISAAEPVLLAGSDGSPWLVAAERATPDVPQLYRLNPWAARFEPEELSPSVRLPGFGRPVLALAPDTFVWVDDSDGAGRLLGLRLGARSRFTHDATLVLSSDPRDPSRPAHLVPTRAPTETTSYDGALTLGDPELTVLVADTDYADVTIELRLAGQALPLVVLGDVVLGGDACPWPEGAASGAGDDEATVVRRGERAELRYRGARAAACSVAPGRLTIGLRAGSAEATVRRLQITRDSAGATAF